MLYSVPLVIFISSDAAADAKAACAAVARTAAPTDAEVAASLASASLRVRVFASEHDGDACTLPVDQLTTIADLAVASLAALDPW